MSENQTDKELIIEALTKLETAIDLLDGNKQTKPLAVEVQLLQKRLADLLSIMDKVEQVEALEHKDAEKDDI